MKTTKTLLIVISFLLLPLSAFAGSNLSSSDQSDVEQTVTNFVKSVDARNTSDLQKTLYTDGSILIFNTFSNKIEHYSANQFVDMVKNGQKGGWVRQVNFASVDVDGNTAIAKIDITDPRLKETGFVTLIKDNGTWKIAGEVSTLGLNK
ncbi:MAG: nuclear transport factor 2 family protein [Ignavibacteriaceae bacterium]